MRARDSGPCDEPALRIRRTFPGRGDRSGSGATEGAGLNVRAEGRGSSLRKNLLDDVSVHVGEAAFDAVVPEGELLVIDAEEVEDGGVEVVD